MIDRASSPGRLWNLDWKQLEGSAAQASGGVAKMGELRQIYCTCGD